MWINNYKNVEELSSFGSGDDDSPTHPPSRCKHSGVLVPNPIKTISNGNNCSSSKSYDLYIYGGRSGTFPLKDFWKLDPKLGTWEEVKSSLCAVQNPGQDDDDLWPPHLQEHSMVYYEGKIYLFGGEYNVTHGQEDLAPLWIFTLETQSWRRWGLINENNSLEEKQFQMHNPDCTRTPLGRRGHSAVVWNNYMLIFGGYRDLKGSLGDLWAFHFGTESWYLFSSQEGHKKSVRSWYPFNKGSSSSQKSLLPCPRHTHVSVLHNNCLYIHGGMRDLTKLQDLWKFDLKTHAWSSIKVKGGPGAMHGHVGVCTEDSLLIMAGEGAGNKAADEFWRLDFGAEQWERLIINRFERPSPRVWSWGGILPLLNTDDDEGEQKPFLTQRRSSDQFDNIVETNSTSASDDSKSLWDYDENVAFVTDRSDNFSQKQWHPQQRQESQEHNNGKPSLSKELTRFAYHNGDYRFGFWLWWW